MEDLLFLSEIQKNFQIGLVSILPEFYAKKLDMISLPGIKYSMDYILKTQGARQKVIVVADGARLFLRLGHIIAICRRSPTGERFT